MRKKLLSYIVFQFIIVLSFFSNEFDGDKRKFSFSIKNTDININYVKMGEKAHQSFETHQKAGIIMNVVGGGVCVPLSIVSGLLTSLSLANIIPANPVLYLMMFPYSFRIFYGYFAPYSFLLYATILISVGSYMLYKSDIILNTKFYATRIIRNIGIGLLSSTALPLAGLIATCIVFDKFCHETIYDNMFFVDDLDVGFGITITTLMFVGQLIGGIVMIAVGTAMSRKRIGRTFSKFTPDLSITHDDKKSFNEGYGVSVGMRVRI